MFIKHLFLALITLLVVDKQDAEVISSHKSGYYVEPFKLVLNANNKNAIRYTLDGSSPTNQSEIFQNELLVTGMESYDSLSFINSTIPDSIANFGWRRPIGIQDKATILKYAAFKNNILKTEIKTLSFFNDIQIHQTLFPNTSNDKGLNQSNIEDLDSLFLNDSINVMKYKLPVTSISTDKKNLYSHLSGKSKK